jgi:hypothetical protein
MEDRSFSPTTWAKVVLAILPGLFALAASSGLLSSALGVRAADILALRGFIGVCLLLVIAGLVRERRLPIWSYPAVGILLALLSAWWWVPLANLLIPVLDAPSAFWGNAPPVLEFALLAAIAAPITYRVYRRHGIHVPRSGWVALGLIILFGVAQVITTTVAAPGPYDWIAVLARLRHELWRMGVVLSAVAIGLPLAWRSGALAGLMVGAFQYMMVDGLVACMVAQGLPVYGICRCTAHQAPVIVLASVTVLLFLIVPPVWVLRSRSARQRVWGLILPPIIAVVVGAAIGLLACRGTPSRHWIGWWLPHLLAGAQYTIAVALATVIYHWIEPQGPAAGTQEHREG